MKYFYLVIAGVILFSAFASSQNVAPAKNDTSSYTKTINARADKIVATLNVNDSAKALQVRDLIASQYRDLNTVYTQRDTAVSVAKRNNAGNKAALDSAMKMIEAATTASTDKLHKQFLQNLSGFLNEEQIVKVKDGMTYGILPLTYNAYLDMLPQLTEPQKKQIMAWLVEAREHAMDAESSDKKHWWFGKYKGRINNYLSSQGYDMKKEGEAWQKRIKEKG
jgi:hypothetical protein